MTNFGRQLKVPVDASAYKGREFLEHFATFDLSGQELAWITGKGSGAERFIRLLEVCRYMDDPTGLFLAQVLLFNGYEPEYNSVNGIKLSCPYLLALLTVKQVLIFMLLIIRYNGNHSFLFPVLSVLRSFLYERRSRKTEISLYFLWRKDLRVSAVSRSARGSVSS